MSERSPSTWGPYRPDASGFGFVVLQGVRADVSGLSAGDKIVAAINSSAAPTGFVPIGQDRTESVGGTVSTVTDGLDVVLGAASRLLCNIGTVGEGGDEVPVGGVPSITVSEGFARAWETELKGTMIALKMNNLPEGVNLRWPNVVNFVQDPADDGDQTWSTLTLTNASRQTAGIPFDMSMEVSLVTDGNPADYGCGDRNRRRRGCRCQQRRDGHLRVRYYHQTAGWAKATRT